MLYYNLHCQLNRGHENLKHSQHVVLWSEYFEFHFHIRTSTSSTRNTIYKFDTVFWFSEWEYTTRCEFYPTSSFCSPSRLYICTVVFCFLLLFFFCICTAPLFKYIFRQPWQILEYHFSKRYWYHYWALGTKIDNSCTLKCWFFFLIVFFLSNLNPYLVSLWRVIYSCLRIIFWLFSKITPLERQIMKLSKVSKEKFF